MAVVFMDGFDYMYGESQFFLKWEDVSFYGGLFTINHTPSSQRRPSPDPNYPIGFLDMGHRLYGSTQRQFNEDHYDTLIFGFAFYSWGLIGAGSNPKVSFQNADGTTVLKVQCNDSLGRVSATCGGVTYYSPTATIEDHTWFHIDCKVVFDDSTGGTLQVRINETTVINQSGIKTANKDSGGDYSFSQITFGNDLNQYSWVDDLYVLDGEGSVANDLIGDCRIDTIYPDANGYYTNFTPVVDPTNWENVEPLVDGNNTQIDLTTYNEGEGTVRECYELSDLLSLSTDIYGIQTNSVVRKTDAGKKQIEQFIRENGANQDSGRVIDMYDFAKNEYYPVTVCPSTGLAWTEADIATLESGIKIVT